MSLKLAFRHELSHGFSNLGKVKLESYFIYLNIKEYIQEMCLKQICLSLDS